MKQKSMFRFIVDDIIEWWKYRKYKCPSCNKKMERHDLPNLYCFGDCHITFFGKGKSPYYLDIGRSGNYDGYECFGNSFFECCEKFKQDIKLKFNCPNCEKRMEFSGRSQVHCWYCKLYFNYDKKELYSWKGFNYDRQSIYQGNWNDCVKIFKKMKMFL